MTFTLSRRAMILASASMLATPAFAESHAEATDATATDEMEPVLHEVLMLNKHPEDKKLRMVFHPRIVTVNPGDTVKFIATDKAHNSASVKGMIPEGVAPWNGKINQDVEVTFDKPGVYGYRCTPHAAMGMVGLVIVKGEGALDNLEEAKGVKQRGRTKKIWDDIWAEVETMDLSA